MIICASQVHLWRFCACNHNVQAYCAIVFVPDTVQFEASICAVWPVLATLMCQIAVHVQLFFLILKIPAFLLPALIFIWRVLLVLVHSKVSYCIEQYNTQMHFNLYYYSLQYKNCSFSPIYSYFTLYFLWTFALLLPVLLFHPAIWHCRVVTDCY